jgi:actin-related protein
MRVVVGPDPRLDAWRGAAHVAARPETFGGRGAAGGGDWGGAVTREEYEERGPDWAREEYGGLASYW